MSGFNGFEEILAPLKGNPCCSADYSQQLKEIMDMDRAFRSIEELYASAYSRVIALEDELANCKEHWQTPVLSQE